MRKYSGSGLLCAQPFTLFLDYSIEFDFHFSIQNSFDFNL